MDGIIGDIPYHFENFVHFGSAEERLENFKYKLQLIESYNASIESINDTSTGDAASWASLFVDDGIRMTIHSKYEEVTSITTALDTSHGLDSSMH